MSNAFGSPCANYREHIGLNSSSYSTAANTDSDDFRFNSSIQGIPARTGHATDSTAYGTQPTADSWQVQLSGTGGANAQAPNQT